MIVQITCAKVGHRQAPFTQKPNLIVLWLGFCLSKGLERDNALTSLFCERAQRERRVRDIDGNSAGRTARSSTRESPMASGDASGFLGAGDGRGP